MKDTANSAGETTQDLVRTSAISMLRRMSGGFAVVSIAVVALSLRPSIVSIGPVLTAIIRDFDLSHTEASLLTAIPDILMGLLALPTPWLARRIGRDMTLILALILLAIATLGRAFATDTALLLLATGGVGAGIAIAGALMAGFIKERFPDRAVAIMGIYATALSLGSTLSAAATGPIWSCTGSWRAAVGIWTPVSLFGIGMWLAASSRSPSVKPLSTGRKHRLPLKDGKAWAIAALFAMLNILFYSLLAWISSIYIERSMSPSQAGFILAAFTFVFMCANPIFGFLSRSVDRRSWIFVAGFLTVCGLLGAILVPALPLIFIPICAFGLGGSFTLVMTLPLDNTSTPEETNAWNAFVLMVGYVVGAAGPLATGLLRDMSGNFGSALWFLAGCAAVMTALSSVLKPRSQQVSVDGATKTADTA